MTRAERPDYRLVYDGERGLRMAPPGAVDAAPEPHIDWNPDGEARLETHIERPAAPRTRPGRVLAVAGLLLFCLVGAGVGLALRDMPRPSDRLHGPAAGQAQVAVKPEAAPAILAMARAEPRLDVRPPAAKAPRPPTKLAGAPAPSVAAPPRPAARASCGWTRTQAEEMVCNDPGLTAADRRLARAYRAAARAGQPLMQLRAEQDDWLDLREDAARVSRRAVAQLYAQRIDELEAMAEPQ